MLGWVINDDTHWAYIGEEEMKKAKAAIKEVDIDMSVFVSIWIYKPYLSSGRYRLFIEDYFLLDKIDSYVRRFDFSTDDPEYLREALPLLWKEGGWWGL